MRVIITGSTKGIGRAIVEAFAEEGHDIAFCSRTAADVKAFATTLREKYPSIDIIGLAVDMSKIDAVKAFATTILEQWNRVDVLINNTGTYIEGLVSEEKEGNLEFQIETNLYSAYYMTRAILPQMKAQKSGHVINMCSIASFLSYPNAGSYSVSKFALLGFTRVLRDEMRVHNIKVTAIMPGATWSAAWEGATLPKDRIMQAEDVAHSVLSVAKMKPGAVVEELIIRPQLGDL
mgnify:CR=1 FL=1